jgi:hypothetical protein
MSNRALELLQATGLLDSQLRVSDLSRYTPENLQGILHYYRNDRLKNAEADAQAARAPAGQFSALVSSLSARNSIEPLLPSCITYHRLLTNDPLIQLTNVPDTFNEVHRASIGMEPAPLPELWRVENALHYFEGLAPLIRDGIITVLPIDAIHAPPAYRPITYSEDWFRSAVPAHLHEFVHRSAIISEVAPGPNSKGLIVWDKPPQKPTRGISIAFANDLPLPQESLYLLWDQRVIEQVDESHFKFAQTLKWDNPPAQELFDAWVYQSVNQAILARLSGISRELSVAERLGATYLTESDFEAELCGMSCGDATAPGSRVSAVNFLNANAPFLKLDDPVLVAKLRSSKPILFERFQQSLLAVTNELGGNNENFEDRAKQLFEKDIRPQIDELNAALIKVAAGIGGGITLGGAAVAVAVLTGPALPLSALLGIGAATAVGEAMPSVGEYLSLRPGPAFIWKRLAK